MAPKAPRSTFFRHSGEDGPGLTITVAGADRARATLRLDGELDLASAPTLTACLHGQLAEGRKRLRLDLSGLTFVDATGLAALVDGHHRLLSERGALVITAMSARCRRLIEMVGLDHTLLIADQPGGITSFRAAGRISMLMGISLR